MKCCRPISGQHREGFIEELSRCWLHIIEPLNTRGVYSNTCVTYLIPVSNTVTDTEDRFSTSIAHAVQVGGMH